MMMMFSHQSTYLNYKRVARWFTDLDLSSKVKSFLSVIANKLRWIGEENPHN
jgi:hypothetical protein